MLVEKLKNTYHDIGERCLQFQTQWNNCKDSLKDAIFEKMQLEEDNYLAKNKVKELNGKIRTLQSRVDDLEKEL